MGVVEYRESPAISTGAAFDATYPVCGDWRRGASLQPLRARFEKPARVAFGGTNPACRD